MVLGKDRYALHVRLPVSKSDRKRRPRCPKRVQGPWGWREHVGAVLSAESGCLKVQPKAGGKLLLRLNITTRPIVNKYREGKLKRTLKREFKSA